VTPVVVNPQYCKREREGTGKERRGEERRGNGLKEDIVKQSRDITYYVYVYLWFINIKKILWLSSQNGMLPSVPNSRNLEK
jgi:hypothetical protein